MSHQELEDPDIFELISKAKREPNFQYRAKEGKFRDNKESVGVVTLKLEKRYSFPKVGENGRYDKRADKLAFTGETGLILLSSMFGFMVLSVSGTTFTVELLVDK